MSLKEKIDQDIKTAMKEKNQADLRGLRAIKSMILLAESEKGSPKDLDQDTEIKLLTKAAKQRNDSLEVYRQSGRTDLAQKEEEELEVIYRYLPKQMSDAELEAELKNIIHQVNAHDQKDMGKVMGVASKTLAGKADGKLIAEKVRALLN
jgi:uncharacterized protein YqeY